MMREYGPTPEEMGLKPRETRVAVQQEHSAEVREELVQNIERAPLDVQERIDILLILKDLKPATVVSLYSEDWKEGGERREVDPEKAKAFEALLRQSGPSYEIPPKSVTDSEFAYAEDDYRFGKREEQPFLLAKDQVSLDMLKKAIETNDERLFGKLYGFPESAISAYLGKAKAADKDKLPEEVKRSDAFAFARFAMSEDNWRGELNVGEKWAKAIREISPTLYHEWMQIIKGIIERTQSIGGEESENSQAINSAEESGVRFPEDQKTFLANDFGPKSLKELFTKFPRFPNKMS